jgi:diphthamide synthase (EF-2-diphthine--ammonia ligase)
MPLGLSGAVSVRTNFFHTRTVPRLTVYRHPPYLALLISSHCQVEDMLVLLADVVRRYPEVDAVCSGAVLSTYQRLRVESVCDRLGLRSLAPLWQRPQGELVDEMIAAGVECVSNANFHRFYCY